jgi:caffeoyl-CoA O-methyltransferase
LDGRLYDYVLSHSVREPAILKELRAETAKLPMAMMQIGPEQGQFMGLLVELTGAKRAIEVGTFTGYSSLSVALAMPADGRLIACDVSEEYTSIARRYWAKAGVAGKIELKLGPAVATLDGLLAAGGAGSFDFAFIAADTPYLQYYEPPEAAPGRPAGHRQRPLGRDVADPERRRGYDGNPGPQ